MTDTEQRLRVERDVALGELEALRAQVASLADELAASAKLPCSRLHHTIRDPNDLTALYLRCSEPGCVARKLVARIQQILKG